MKYDFLSFQNYKCFQQACITQATMNLKLNNSEIKSILSVPIDSQALAKAGDYIKNHLVELEKALVVAGNPAKSFRRNSHQVVIERALAFLLLPNIANNRNSFDQEDLVITELKLPSYFSSLIK